MAVDVGVLNPLLYRRLIELFGDVRVTNVGVARVERRTPDPFRYGRIRTARVVAGEEYAASCPFCQDRRHRLSINHRYSAAGRARSLAKCFNEDCLSDPANLEKLAAMIGLAAAAPAGIAGAGSDAVCTVTWPENVVPIDFLPAEHPARGYLVSRGFDPAELAADWQVGFVDGESSAMPDPAGRIFVPVLGVRSDAAGDTTVALGWQARSVPGIEAAVAPGEKYLTMRGLAVARVLYGLPAAAAAGGPVVLVEGVTDAWRYGPGALALFGKSVGAAKAALIRRLLPGRDVVVMLDADAAKEGAAAMNVLRRELPGRRIARAVLPPGCNDPGECSAQELRESVAAALGLPTVAVAAAGSRPVRVGRGGFVAAARPDSPLSVLADAMSRAGIPVGAEALARRLEAERGSNRHATLEALRRRVADDGRIHAKFREDGTRTGRITACDPPLQNLPRELRPVVVAPAGRVLLTADYKSFEPRIAAGLSGDPGLAAVFRESCRDLYRELSSFLEPMTGRSLSRPTVKALVSAFLHGGGTTSVSSSLGIPAAVAAATHGELSRRFPRLSDWLMQIEADSAATGVVVTPVGRRIPAVDSRGRPLGSRAAGVLLQAAAADLFNQRIVRLAAALPAKASLLLPLHDAVLIECPDDAVPPVAEVARLTLERESFGGVMFELEIAAGRSWCGAGWKVW